MRFLKELYAHCDNTDGFLEIRTLPDRRQYWLNSPVIPADILSLKTNVFFGVGLRSRKEGTADAVSSLPALFIDMDAKDFGGDMAACARRLWDGFRWHAIIRTGGGFHAYRRLERPARTIEEKARLIAAMKQVAAKLGGDKAACDVARILRVPETQNFKYAPPRPVEMKYQNWEYDDLQWDEIRELSPAPVQLVAHGTTETPEVLSRIVDRCSFMQHCEECAATLSEPEWYAWISNLVANHKSPRYIHEVSRRYPRYSPSETDRKILHALDDSNPITCARIKEMWDCGRVCGVKSPAGLAFRIPAAPEVAASPNPFRFEGQGAEDLGGEGNPEFWLLEGLRGIRLLPDGRS